jgi:hypothetical protein
MKINKLPVQLHFRLMPDSAIETRAILQPPTSSTWAEEPINKHSNY